MRGLLLSPLAQDLSRLPHRELLSRLRGGGGLVEGASRLASTEELAFGGGDDEGARQTEGKVGHASGGAVLVLPLRVPPPPFFFRAPYSATHCKTSTFMPSSTSLGSISTPSTSRQQVQVQVRAEEEESDSRGSVWISRFVCLCLVAAGAVVGYWAAVQE